MANVVVNYTYQRHSVMKNICSVRMSFSEEEWDFLKKYMGADAVDADRKFRSLLSRTIDRWMRLGREVIEQKKDPAGD